MRSPANSALGARQAAACGSWGQLIFHSALADPTWAVRGFRPNGDDAVIYILAVLLPPLGLLLNGQPFAAILNLALIVPCVLLGFFFPVLWLLPSIHAVIAVHMRREDRKHREIVDAIERHGPPPGFQR
jgi:hypothetical protein